MDYAGNPMISQISLFPTALDGEVLMNYLPGKTPLTNLLIHQHQT